MKRETIDYDFINSSGEWQTVTHEICVDGNEIWYDETTQQTNFNDIKRFCILNRISLNEFSKATGLERTRVHRLAHATDLLHKLSVKELGKITDAYPTFLLDY